MVLNTRWLLVFVAFLAIATNPLLAQRVGGQNSGGGSGTITGCAGTPGNTTGAYRSQCQTTAGAVYACNNAAGCTVAADWVAVAGAGGSGFTTIVGPSFFTWTPSGSTDTATVASQTQNTFLAAPNGSNGPGTFRAIVAADIPTLNQSTSSTAANLSGTPTLPNGTLATTQSQADGSTKIATTAYVDTGLGGKASTNAATTVNGQSCALGSTCTVAGSGQTNASVMPNTVPSAGQFPVGNAGGTAYAPVALSGDCSLASTGAITCTESSGTALGTGAFATIANYAPLANPNHTGTISDTGTASTDSATLGTELTTSGNCCTNWTGSYNSFTAPGTTAVLTSTLAAVIGNYYQVAVTVVTAGGTGSVTIAFGAQSTTAVCTATGTTAFGPKATSTAVFTVTPVSTCTATISVSVKQITPISTYAIALKDSGGNVSVPFTQQLASLHNLFIGGGGVYNTTGGSNTAKRL